MPVPRKATNALRRAVQKLYNACQTGQGACLLKHEAEAVYKVLAALQEKLKQDVEQKEPVEPK
jgi:predicted signal transduction protein with EAL and GGDEF domain